MFSFGAQPYAEQGSIQRVLEFVRSGRRLARPARCPLSLHTDLLMRCWAVCPTDRPAFAAIVGLLEHHMEAWARDDPDAQNAAPLPLPAATPFPRKFVDRAAVQALTGRADVVESIRIKFDTSTSSCAMVAVRGLGGMGKTSAVKKYIHEEARSYPGGIFWLVADTLKVNKKKREKKKKKENK